MIVDSGEAKTGYKMNKLWSWMLCVLTETDWPTLKFKKFFLSNLCKCTCPFISTYLI
jgi:hypothetical protein